MTSGLLRTTPRSPSAQSLNIDLMGTTWYIPLVSNVCKNCRFFDIKDHTNGNGGTCKRRAPQVYGQHGNAKWPAAHSNDWCGEFTPKVEDRSDAQWRLGQ